MDLHRPGTPWPRVLAKAALFVSRGVAPATAWWLARHDAIKRLDYRGARRADLAAGWTATRDWNALEVTAGVVRAPPLELPFAGDDLVCRGHRTLVALHGLGFRAERAAGGLIVSHPAWQLRLTTDEEISMAQEIFVEGCYDLRLTGEWNVLDIGANVGMASLYFAAQPWVHRVFAFEPFGPTAVAHAAQVALNPRLAPKIRLAPYGLGEATETGQVEYHRAFRGSMTVRGLGHWRGAPAAGAETVTVHVRRASEVIQELAPDLAGRPTLAKIDCEGSEYGIVRDLDRTAQWDAIDLVVMEWHGGRPDELVDRLGIAGFQQQVRATVDNRTQGLILAWRDRAPRSGP